jgi:hypothetical protein
MTSTFPSSSISPVAWDERRPSPAGTPRASSAPGESHGSEIGQEDDDKEHRVRIEEVGSLRTGQESNGTEVRSVEERKESRDKAQNPGVFRRETAMQLCPVHTFAHFAGRLSRCASQRVPRAVVPVLTPPAVD